MPGNRSKNSEKRIQSFQTRYDEKSAVCRAYFPSRKHYLWAASYDESKQNFRSGFSKNLNTTGIYPALCEEKSPEHCNSSTIPVYCGS